MPVRVRTAHQHTAMFVVDADAAQRMIDYSGLQVCRFGRGNRRALVVLMLMRYEDTDLGRYWEYGTNVMVNPPGSHARSGVCAACSRRARSSITCPSTRRSRWKPAARSGAIRR